MSEKREVNKMPAKVFGGSVTIPDKSHKKDITKLTLFELRDMKERNEQVLQNKTLLGKLRDKGKQIQEMHAALLLEIEKRMDIERLAAEMSQLNFADYGKKFENHLEWGQKLAEAEAAANDAAVDVLDSDDEAVPMDPLRIIAQAQALKRVVKTLPPEPTLITEQDLQDIKEMQEDGTQAQAAEVKAELLEINVLDKLPKIKTQLQSLLDKQEDSSVTAASVDKENQAQPSTSYAQHYLQKSELDMLPKCEKFKPHKTSKCNVHHPDVEVLRKHRDNWESTAASPPLLQHPGVQFITLQESKELLSQQLSKLQELHEQQLAERMEARLARLARMGIDDSTAVEKAKSVLSTKMPNVEGDLCLDELEEITDPCDIEKGGFVYYTTN